MIHFDYWTYWIPWLLNLLNSFKSHLFMGMSTYCFITEWVRKEFIVICKRLQKHRRKLYFYWLGFYIQFARCVNGRFYSCLPYVYVYKYWRKIFVYVMYLTVVAFMITDNIHSITFSATFRGQDLLNLSFS